MTTNDFEAIDARELASATGGKKQSGTPEHVPWQPPTVHQAEGMMGRKMYPAERRDWQMNYDAMMAVRQPGKAICNEGGSRYRACDPISGGLDNAD